VTTKTISQAVPATTAGTDIATQKADAVASFTALVKGLNTDLPNVDPFVVSGKSIPRATVLGTLQGRIDAAEQTRAARTAFHLAVENERAVALDANTLRAGLKLMLQNQFGPKSTKLQEFGFIPRKKPKTKAATKAESSAKAQATKKARGIVRNAPPAAVGTPAPATPVPAKPPAGSAVTGS
jgi:hypothetical protein